jgi:hypothetical protein
MHLLITDLVYASTTCYAILGIELATEQQQYGTEK